MLYRNFGRTGLKVSPICLGCMMCGGKTEPDESYQIIDRAIDVDINFFDTANVYNHGRSEEVTGEALKRNGKRKKIILATKFHGRMEDRDPNAMGSSRRHIIEQCESSLKRLKTDYIDLYQVHRPRSDTAIDETLRALDDLVRSGKIRYIGTTTFAAWQVVEALWVSKEFGLNRFISEQPPYNILDRRIERELLPMAQTFGIGTLTWSPLAGGLLTGKYSLNKPPPNDTRYSTPNENQKIRYTNASLEVVDRLKKYLSKKGVSISQFSIAWTISQAGVTSSIIGPRNMEQFEDNLKALEIKISEEDILKVDEQVPPGTFVSPHYQANFGPHDYRI